MTDAVVRIALVAGEASGDLLASQLIHALRAKLPNAVFFWRRRSENAGPGF
jgi:lipid-A-disaccharide synthase